MRQPHRHFTIRYAADGTYRNNKHGWNATMFKEDNRDCGTRFWKNLREVFNYADKLGIPHLEVVDANGKVQVKPDFSVPYGYCPHCQAEVVAREKSPHGNDKCRLGHIYPMKNTLHNRDEPLHF